MRRVRRDSNRIRGVGVGGRGSGRRTTHHTSVNATVLRYDASELATCVFIYVCLSTQFKVLEENLSMDDLIEIVRQYKVIYDTKCKEYRDQSIRASVWEEIGEKIKQPRKY